MGYDSEQFLEQGYLVCRRLVDPEEHTEPLLQGYSELFEAMDLVLRLEWDADPFGNAGPKTTCADRFTRLLVLGGHLVMDHLDPVLNSRFPSYTFREDFPPGQFPELLGLFRNDAILDVIEDLIGTEINGLHYGFTFRIGEQHKQLLASQARRHAVYPRESDLCFKRHCGNSSWHRGTNEGINQFTKVQAVNAWVPLTACRKSNGGLRVIPKSHLGLVSDRPAAGQLKHSVSLEVDPGDVVFLDNNTFRSNFANTSDGADCSQAISFSYSMPALPPPNPHLPSFVARSRNRTPLTNPLVWSQMWRTTLSHHMVHKRGIPIPRKYFDVPCFFNLWSEYGQEPHEWISLRKRPNYYKAGSRLKNRLIGRTEDLSLLGDLY